MNEEDIELELDNVEASTESKLKVKNRFEQLSEKVIVTSKERDELAKAKESLEAEKSSLAKERDFFKDFSTNVSKYPQATEYQEQILEKVKSGYSTKAAILEVLDDAGKLSATPSQAPAFNGQVEGGSSPTTFEGNKSLDQMSVEDKLSALMDAEKSGSLVNALRS